MNPYDVIPLPLTLQVIHELLHTNNIEVALSDPYSSTPATLWISSLIGMSDDGRPIKLIYDIQPLIRLQTYTSGHQHPHWISNLKTCETCFTLTWWPDYRRAEANNLGGIDHKNYDLQDPGALDNLLNDIRNLRDTAGYQEVPEPLNEYQNDKLTSQYHLTYKQGIIAFANDMFSDKKPVDFITMTQKQD